MQKTFFRPRIEMTDMKGRDKDERKSVDTKKVKGKPSWVEGAAVGPGPWGKVLSSPPSGSRSRKGEICEAL